MKVETSNKLQDNRHELTISVGAEVFKEAVDKAFKKNSKRINVPGFRKGKAPRAMIEKMYGEGVFFEDAVNELYPKAYEQAVEDSGIEPVDYPEIEVTDLSAEGFIFKATVTVKPEISIKDYKGIKADKIVYEVGEDEITSELTRMQEQNGRMIDVDGRAAQDGDTANIDFEGFVDDKAFPGGKGEGYPLILGSGQFIPGFEGQVVGKEVGAEFDVTVDFPAEYHAAELAGKPAVFKVKLNSLKVKELPALDDEFAKDVSEFDTLALLKDDIKAKAQTRKDDRSRADLENSLVDSLIANMEGDIPAIMIDNRAHEMVHDFEHRLQGQGMNLETYMQYTGGTVEDMKESFKEQAERQVKVRLCLEKIAALESIEVNEQDLTAEYEKMAEAYKIEVDKIREMVPAKEISGDMLVQKAIDFVRENAKVTEKPEEKEQKAPAKE